MSAPRERRTLVRLSVAAGSAATFTAAWLGIIQVEQGASAAASGTSPAVDPALAARATPPPVTPPPTPATGTAVTATTPANAPAGQAAALQPAPAQPAAAAPAAPAPRTVVVPATTPAPAPVQRVITRRSRAS